MLSLCSLQMNSSSIQCLNSGIVHCDKLTKIYHTCNYTLQRSKRIFSEIDSILFEESIFVSWTKIFSGTSGSYDNLSFFMFQSL